MGLKRGLRGVCEYLYLQLCTLYMLILCQNYNFIHVGNLRGVFDTYTYIRCVYSFALPGHIALQCVFNA